MSINRGMNKRRYGLCVCVHTECVHTHRMDDYSAVKKNAATWMDLEISTLSEVTQKEEDKYHTIPLICGI